MTYIEGLPDDAQITIGNTLYTVAMLAEIIAERDAVRKRIEAARQQLADIDDRQNRARGRGGTDVENDHVKADVILLDCIDDPEIRRIFNSLNLWYA